MTVGEKERDFADCAAFLTTCIGETVGTVAILRECEMSLRVLGLKPHSYFL